MNHSNLVMLSLRDLQQVTGGLTFTVPGCILYVPGFPGGGATTSPVSPEQIAALIG